MYSSTVWRTAPERRLPTWVDFVRKKKKKKKKKKKSAKNFHHEENKFWKSRDGRGDRRAIVFFVFEIETTNK